MAKSIHRTVEFKEGYDACDRFISRHRNPYDPSTQPDKYVQWFDGWNKRFYQEPIDSEP